MYTASAKMIIEVALGPNIGINYHHQFKKNDFFPPNWVGRINYWY